MNRRLLFVYVLTTLGLLAFVGLPIACGLGNPPPPADQPTGDTDAGGDDSDLNGDVIEPLDAISDDGSTATCTLAAGNDPVGFCIQKAAIIGEHAQLVEAGVAAYWSVATGLTATTDGGAMLHDFHDDVSYGAALSGYYAATTAYGDTTIQPMVKGDMQAVAALVESELSPLPAEYDGTLYYRLRKFAEGLRLIADLQDAYAIDLLAEQYGRAIYTSYFHALAALPPPDAGAASDDGGPDDAGVSDAAVADAGSGPGDGILGVPSGGGYAYQADQAAAGAFALVDMASRALNGTLFPPPLPPDAGPDGSTIDIDAAAPPPDKTDAALWSQAAVAVFAHLDARARDAVTGLYFTSLTTSSGGNQTGHDAVTDSGALTSDTQGLVALSLLRAGALANGLPALSGYPFADNAAALLNAAQGASKLALWDPTNNALTLNACNSAVDEDAGSCGTGFFASTTSAGVFDSRKTIRGNAFLFAALHLSTLVSNPDLFSLRALFTDQTGTQDGFFTQVLQQSSFLRVVARDFEFENAGDDAGDDAAPVDDAGLGDPYAQFYSAAANADALEGLCEQWVGIPNAPPYFSQ